MDSNRLKKIVIYAIAYYIIRVIWEYVQDGPPDSRFLVQELLFAMVAGWAIEWFSRQMKDKSGT